MLSQWISKHTSKISTRNTGKMLPTATSATAVPPKRADSQGAVTMLGTAAVQPAVAKIPKGWTPLLWKGCQHEDRNCFCLLCPWEPTGDLICTAVTLKAFSFAAENWKYTPPIPPHLPRQYQISKSNACLDPTPFPWSHHS